MTDHGPQNDIPLKYGASESGCLVQIRAFSSEIAMRPQGAAGLPRNLARAAGM
jgi:hypothetical protein